MSKRISREESARLSQELAISQKRQKLEKNILEPALAKHDYDLSHPEVLSARRIVNSTLARIYNPPSNPLPMDTVLRIGHINSQGYMEPVDGFVDRGSADDDSNGSA